MSVDPSGMSAGPDAVGHQVGHVDHVDLGQPGLAAPVPMTQPLYTMPDQDHSTVALGNHPVPDTGHQFPVQEQQQLDPLVQQQLQEQQLQEQQLQQPINGLVQQQLQPTDALVQQQHLQHPEQYTAAVAAPSEYDGVNSGGHYSEVVSSPAAGYAEDAERVLPNTIWPLIPLINPNAPNVPMSSASLMVPVPPVPGVNQVQAPQGVGVGDADLSRLQAEAVDQWAPDQQAAEPIVGTDRSVWDAAMMGAPERQTERSRAVEARVAQWVAARVQKGEPLSARQVRDSFHKQHRAAGGTPQELAKAIQDALTASGATISSPQQGVKRKGHPRSSNKAPKEIKTMAGMLVSDGSMLGQIDPITGQPVIGTNVGQVHIPLNDAPSLPATHGTVSIGDDTRARAKAVEVRVHQWVSVRVAKGELLSAKKVRDSFHKQHRAAGGTPQELAASIQAALLACGAKPCPPRKTKKRNPQDSLASLLPGGHSMGDKLVHGQHAVLMGDHQQLHNDPNHHSHTVGAVEVPLGGELGRFQGVPEPGVSSFPVALPDGSFFQSGMNETTGGEMSGCVPQLDPMGGPKAVESQLIQWVQARVQSGETVSPQQLAELFQKQHQAVGGMPDDLARVIHDVMISTGLAVSGSVLGHNDPHDVQDSVHHQQGLLDMHVATVQNMHGGAMSEHSLAHHHHHHHLAQTDVPQPVSIPLPDNGGMQGQQQQQQQYDVSQYDVSQHYAASQKMENDVFQ